ncbi:hypothetical protein POM88_023699 [Heracleum sosnowskyi]|uniref:Ribosome-inactivating protein n=1 Tax=Heracleum sosnowskyi TaxID=360622 RepID=A0AAD8IJ79_9APIA|nr:hypothetical protein POM88_023699 [Heracleum sosnowskyi]
MVMMAFTGRERGRRKTEQKGGGRPDQKRGGDERRDCGGGRWWWAEGGGGGGRWWWAEGGGRWWRQVVVVVVWGGSYGGRRSGLPSLPNSIHPTRSTPIQYSPCAMSIMVSRLLVFVVSAAWLVSSICTARNDVLFMSPERVSEKLTFYPIVPFDTAHATRTRYQKFIENVREEMLSVDKVHGISRLQKPANLLESDRYLLVALFSSAGARIILAIDRANANVVAYRSQYKVYVFPDIDVPASVFSGIKRELLAFKSSYSAMEKVAKSRSLLMLGMAALDRSIQLIDDTKTSYMVNNHAVFLLVASQMVSDAIRYRYVERTVLEHIRDEKSYAFTPNATMIALEDNWKELSTRIQQSVAGVIDPGFVLPGVSNTLTTIYPILGPQIALMLYVCDDCPKGEPTVNLIGRNGFCADVQDSYYYDGNPLILWPCRSTENGNQLFTLKKDGTIRCQGKCLTAYQLKEDRYVMIHDCTTAPKNSGIKWVLEGNGNIINKEHNLALNAFVGYQWSVLTVDQITYSSRQGWSFSSREPTVTPIISYNGMYMQAANNSVLVVEANSNSVPEWEIFADGTIRPSKTKTNCLARKSADDTNVGLHECDGGTAERWLLHHDGISIIISDANNQYVLGVNKDQKIVVVKGSADTPTTEQIFSIDIKLK